MHYSCGIVRPPYEANSVYLQVTAGCTHNTCRFCTFFKEAPFSVSPESEIIEDLEELASYGVRFPRIFLQALSSRIILSVSAVTRKRKVESSP